MRWDHEISTMNIMARGAGRRQIFGILWMCFASMLMFPASNAAAKFLAADYHLIQIIWFRSVIHIAFLLVIFLPVQSLPKLFTTLDLRGQLFRSLVQVVAVACFWVALIWLPITNATAIGLTAPLMVVVLSVFLLGERVRAPRWIAVAIGFVGALIIIRPGGDVHWSVVLVIISMILYALFIIQTRRLAALDDPRTTAVYAMVVACVASTVLLPFFWVTPQNLTDLLVFTGLGFAGALAHIGMIKAVQYTEVSLVAPFDYSQLIGAAILGYAIFAELPDLWTWVGAAIIVASGVYVARREATYANN